MKEQDSLLLENLLVQVQSFTKKLDNYGEKLIEHNKEHEKHIGEVNVRLTEMNEHSRAIEKEMRERGRQAKKEHDEQNKKIDEIKVVFEKRVDATDLAVMAVSKRVAILETWRTFIAGAFAVITFMFFFLEESVRTAFYRLFH